MPYNNQELDSEQSHTLLSMLFGQQQFAPTDRARVRRCCVMPGTPAISAFSFELVSASYALSTVEFFEDSMPAFNDFESYTAPIVVQGTIEATATYTSLPESDWEY